MDMVRSMIRGHAIQYNLQRRVDWGMRAHRAIGPPWPGTFEEIVATFLFAVRAIAVFVWTTSVFAVRMLGRPLRFVSPKLELAYRAACLSIWGRGVLPLLGARIRLVGNPPARPFFLVCNHQTLLDMVLLWAVVDTAYVSKDEVADWPLIGTMARGMDTIFINRESARDTMRVNALIKESLDRGLGITVFAEGGCGDGTGVIPFKAPLLQPVAVLNMPVHYAVINYRTPKGTMPPGTVMVWREGVTFPQYCVDVMKMPWFEATIEFGDTPKCGTERKKLAHELWEDVNARFVPVNVKTESGEIAPIN